MKSFKVMALVFCLIGSAVFIGGVFWLKSTMAFAARAQHVVGEIAKQNTDTCEKSVGSGNSKRNVSYTCYQPVVKYQIKGQVQESAMSERSSNTYDIGSKVDLLVDPAAPSKAEFKGASLWLGPGFLLLFGTIFSAVGFFLLRSSLRSEKLIKELKVSGVVINGKVTYCGPDQSISVNGRNPWKVEASWVHPSNGKVYVTKTQEELWHNPVQMGQISQSGEVQIKYNPEKPEHSMVVLGAAPVQSTHSNAA
jgi:hypothetical protein